MARKRKNPLIFEVECEDGKMEVELRRPTAKEWNESNDNETTDDKIVRTLFVEGSVDGDEIEPHEIFSDEATVIMVQFNNFLVGLGKMLGGLEEKQIKTE